MSRAVTVDDSSSKATQRYRCQATAKAPSLTTGVDLEAPWAPWECLSGKLAGIPALTSGPRFEILTDAASDFEPLSGVTVVGYSLQAGVSSVVRQAASVEEHLRAVFGHTKKLDQLCEQVAGIDSKLEQVLKNLAELSALRRSFLVPIESLEPEPYEILRPFTAVVTEGEGEFEASVFDLSIFASGETEEEAIANLKGTLIDTVDRLNELPDARLGKGPLRQKNLLNKYIRRVEKG